MWSKIGEMTRVIMAVSYVFITIIRSGLHNENRTGLFL